MEDNRSGYYYGYIIVAAMFLIMVIIWGTVTSFGVFFESLLKRGFLRCFMDGW